MRFLLGGPNIPDELLEERDNGNVVFLCGAGVSYPAGMPDFLGLTRYVVGELAPLEDDPPRVLLSQWDDEKNVPVYARPSLDQIFNLLQHEYRADEIDYLIARRLETKRRAYSPEHETILRLSRSDDGQPQIVTTNFDLLFEEAAGQKLRTYVPPALPDLAAGQPINGLVYLHGRIDTRIRRGEGRQGLVVSSADFGLAYLAEGWATRFMRDLLDRYIVVLLGYSANDPPVSYLLQGLNAQQQRNRKPLFAFDSGTEEAVQQRWRDRGVQALAYPADDKHSALWDTLSAWADRAGNPPLWRQGIVDMARRGPRNLVPHERGQVASLVRTDSGAKLFADADPPLSGEWLCVFDHHVRYGAVGRSHDGSQPDFDPLAEYSLDDDPPRPPSNWNKTGRLGDDLLSLRSTEYPTNTSTRLAGTDRQFIAPLPPRLAHLADWIVKIAHEPVALWWAAKYPALHPYLLGWIERRVRQANDETLHLARPIWRLLIEKFRATFDDDAHSRWYKTLDRLKTEGWTNGVLRAFERWSAPHLKIEPLWGITTAAPNRRSLSGRKFTKAKSWTLRLRSRCSMHCPKSRTTFSRQSIRFFADTWRGQLGCSRASAPSQIFGRPQRFILKREPENIAASQANFFFRSAICSTGWPKHSPGCFRADIALWLKGDLFFFNKLHLWAWTFDTLFSGDEVADGLLSLSDEAFWKEYERRERLWLLRRRWCDLPTGKRERLERRLVNGRARCDGEAEDDYKQRRSSRSATTLGWLIKQGCELSDDTRKALPALQSADPRWRPEWDETADASYDGKAGSVRIDSDPSRILDVPLDQIVPVAKEYTRQPFGELTAYRPFDGLVKQRPSRAVAALTNAARQG